MVTLPAGATQSRTEQIMDQITHYYLTKESGNVESVFTVNGFSFSGKGQNNGLAFVRLKPWDEREGSENEVGAIVARATKAFTQIKDGMVFAFNLPAITELGTATGFDFELIDQASLGHAKLTQARNQLLGMVAQHKDSLVRVRLMVWKICRSLNSMSIRKKRSLWGYLFRILTRQLLLRWEYLCQ